MESSELRASVCTDPGTELRASEALHGTPVLQENVEKRKFSHNSMESPSQSNVPPHQSRIHKTLECEHCSKLFTSKRALRIHITHIHFPRDRYQCGACSYRNSKSWLVDRHWRAVHKGPPTIIHRQLTCRICKKKFSNTLLKFHKSSEHGDILQCPLCVECKVFQSVQYVKAHFLSVHGSEAWEKDQFLKYVTVREKVNKIDRDKRKQTLKCFLCKTEWHMLRSGLLKHIIQSHYRILPFECKNCSFHTSSKATLRNHYQVKHPTSEHGNPIEHLHQKFEQKAKFLENNCENAIIETEISEPGNILIKFEPGELESSGITETIPNIEMEINKPGSSRDLEECVCELCKSLSTEENKGHIKVVHSCSEYRYQCVKCGYGSYHLNLLKHHITTQHTTSACKFCGKEVSEVENHVKHAHMSELRCCKCRQVFMSMGELQSHFINSHGIKDYKTILINKIYDIEKCMDFEQQAPFKCYICKKKWERRKDVMLHILVTHFEIKRLICRLCPFKCQVVSTMRRHMALDHSSIFKSTRVGYIFGDWEPDIPSEQNMETSQSEIAEEAIKLESATVKNTEKCYGCPKCSYATFSKENLRSHVKYKHSMTIRKNEHGLFICDKCNRDILTEKHFKIHESIVHGSEIHCPVCEEGALNIPSLQVHFVSTHPQIPWEDHEEAVRSEINLKVKYLQENSSSTCLFCTKFISGSKLAMQCHIEIEHYLLGTKIKCDLCSFTCWNNLDMQNHSLKFHPEKDTAGASNTGPVQQIREPSENQLELGNSSSKIVTASDSTKMAVDSCYICGAKLDIKSNIRQHLTIYHSVLVSLPYFCALCDQFFTHQFSMEAHWYVTHGELSKPRHTRFPAKNISFSHARLTKFPCMYCNCYFRNEEELVAHETDPRIHLNVYVCSWCKFSSEIPEAVQSHIKVKHTSRIEPQTPRLCVTDNTVRVGSSVVQPSSDLGNQAVGNFFTPQSICHSAVILTPVATLPQQNSNIDANRIKVEHSYCKTEFLDHPVAENLISDQACSQEINIKEEEVLELDDQLPSNFKFIDNHLTNFVGSTEASNSEDSTQTILKIEPEEIDFQLDIVKEEIDSNQYES